MSHGRFRWTERLRVDLMRCYERSNRQVIGYMARLRDLFVEMHPEFATRVSEQQLRDYVAYLQRIKFVAPTSPAAVARQQMQPQILAADVGTRTPNQDRGLARHNLRSRTLPKPRDLERANSQLVDVLSENCNLWQVNCAVYEAAAGLITPRPKFKSGQTSRMAKLTSKIKLTRQLASQIQCVIDYITTGRKFTSKVRRFAHQLRTSHHTLNKLKLQTIKQRLADKIRVLAEAKRRLVKRERSIWQNALFITDPSRLFKQRQPAPRELPTKIAVENFWGDIYEQTPRLNADTPAIILFTEWCDNILQPHEECPPVSVEEVTNAIKGTKNFSAPGWDGINNYWWKKFAVTHQYLARIFTSYINGETIIPDWLVEGRTVLIPKKGDLSNPKNYRPITCLNTVYKIFTTILNNRIARAVDPIWRRTYEQRGCKTGVSGCRDNLLIDRCICQDAVYYKRNLSMAWLDYTKAFDSTSHELIILLLKRLRIHPNIVRCIEELMPLWRTRFVMQMGKRKIYTRLIQFLRGVYQGDTLSPLLFCISLLPLSVVLRQSQGYMCGPPNRRTHKVTHLFYLDDLKLYASGEVQLQRSLNISHIYSRDIGMEFGLDKCAVVHLHRGRSTEINNNDIELVNNTIIHHLGVEETYSYLGLPQRHVQDVVGVKTILFKNYRRLLRNIWSSELSGKFKVEATNMFAIPPILYSFGGLKWNVDELRNFDRSTRKILHMYRSVHPRSSVERLYMPRNMGGRGLLSLERMHDRIVLDTACGVINRTEDPLLQFVHMHEIEGKGAFLYNAAERAAGTLGLIFNVGAGGAQEDDSVITLSPLQLKARIRNSEVSMLAERHQGKPLHGLFFRHLQEHGLSRELTFAFLKSAGLKSETEGFICACQDGVIATLSYRQHVLKQAVRSSQCSACGQHEETIMHILAACPIYAVSAYIHRHNAALRVLYYHLRSTYEIDATPILPYAPLDIESVVGNDSCRIYWNYSFPTSRQIQANKPDIVLVDFDVKTIYVIEFSAPAESNISVKEDEKRMKYQDLLFEIRKGYRGFHVKLVVLIIGVLGGIRNTFLSNLKEIPACRKHAQNIASRMQKAVILGSLRLLRSHETL